MKLEVLVEERACDFIRRQPPEARKHLRAATHDIMEGVIFPEPLEDELDGFYKVKVNRYRLILQCEPGKSGPRFKIVFAERRNVVYELFSQILGLE